MPKIVSASSREMSTSRKIIRCIAFLPATILLIERIYLPFDLTLSGYLDVESLAATTSLKKSVPATQTTPSSSISFSKVYPLERITQSYKFIEATTTCPRGTKKIQNQIEKQQGTSTLLIPNIVHQQGTSKCVKSQLYDVHDNWKLQGWGLLLS
jgi:hypothetical protein